MRLATLQQRDGCQRVLAFADDETHLYPVAGACDAQGQTADPAWNDPDVPAWLLPESLERLRALDAGRAAAAPPAADLTHWRLFAPVPKPGKIVATGRNYLDHVREGQEIWAKRGKTVEIPKFPSAFAKFASSLSGPHDDIVLPAGLDDVDYEVELAVFIGRPALDVSRDAALEHVAGYAVCNDVATRGIQRREMEQQIGITLAKNFPSFAPMGPWLTTSDSVPDPQALGISLSVDGEVRQDANTSDMIFPVAELVSYWSRMGLETGDIIITGTPSGVALARPEPERFYLRAGQLVTARVEGLGALRNRVR